MEWEALSLDEIEDGTCIQVCKQRKENSRGIYTKSDASGDIHKFCTNMIKTLEEKYGVETFLIPK